MSTALLHTLVALIITFRYKFYEGPITSGYPHLPIADAIFSHFWFFCTLNNRDIANIQALEVDLFPLELK